MTLFAKSSRCHLSHILLVVMCLSLSPHAHASTVTAEVDALIDAGTPPDGVVFELISGDPQTWQWATPLLRKLRNRLQKRYPGLDVVVVSHGSEQFQLLAEREGEQPQAIAGLRELAGEGMHVHVCGVHSSWRNVSEDKYADFVDVSPSGPAQINDYRALGYHRIMLRKPQ